MAGFNESVQDPVVADSNINSLEKYKFEVDGNTVYVRTKTTGEFVFSGLSRQILITTMLVTDVATPIPATALSFRNSISITNKSGSDTLYIGPSTVTADTVIGITSGWEIPPSESFNFDVTNDIPVYAIAESGKTILIKVLEMA